MEVHTVTAEAESFTCNAYLVPGELTTLVDAGAYDGVVGAVSDRVDDLDAVVLTHQHGDHVEQLSAVVEAFQPDVYAFAEHPLRTDAIADGDVVVHDDGAFDYGSFGRTDMPGQSRETLVESIEQLLDRMPESVEHMYAGHGGEFHGDVRDVVETAFERAEKREPKYPDE